MADDDLAGDLMAGVPAIAGFLGKTPRQIYHLLESKKLPAFKMGGQKEGIWHARKSTLRRYFEQLEAGGA
jgi:hypothetical protein